MARGKKKESALTPEEKLAQALIPYWEQPYKVPKNWCWVKLSALSSLISKGTTPTGGKNAYVPDGIHFLRVENINDDGTISHDNIACVTEEMHTGFLKRSMLENRDVLISIAGTLGKTGIVQNVDLPLNTNQAVAFVRLKNETINERYIKGVIDNPIAQESLLSKTKVTSIPNLTLEIIGDCPIPLAPAAEQQRIVDRIEYLFSKLDEAKEKAQSVLDSFETRKAAILHKAFTGELTAKWRAEHGVPEDSWSTVDILRLSKPGKDALKAGPFGSALKKSMYVPEGYKIYGQEQVIAGDETIGDYYINDAKYQELISCKIAPHDILISLVGTVGKVLVLSDTCKPGIINPRLIKVSLDEGVMMPYFFKYYFESDSLKEKYKGESHGITMDVLNMRILKMLPFPLCTLEEQAEIVRILDNLLVKEQQAKEAAEAVLEKIDLLKKSILARAFRGKLGTNDPTEASALELLKTIL